MYMNGAPGNNLNNQPNVRESITDEIARIIEESSKTPFPKSLEVATAEVLGRRQREKWKEERKHTDKEPTTQLFPLKETDEFKTFVNKSLTAKTLDEMLAVIEKYEKIPVKIFDSGLIDEVDGKAMKGMIEKYLEDANFTQENTESYSFDINGIELFKGKLSGLLIRETEKRKTKEKISEQEKSTPVETATHPETHIPENLPLETPLVLVNKAVGTPEEPTVGRIDQNIFAVKRGFFATVTSRLVDRAKRAGKTFIALQDKIEAEYDNQIGVPPKKDSSVSSKNNPTTTDYTKPTNGNGVHFSVIPENNSPQKASQDTDFEHHDENLLEDNAPHREEQNKPQEDLPKKPIKSVLRKSVQPTTEKVGWFKNLFSKKERGSEEPWDWEFPAKDGVIPVLNDQELENPSAFNNSEAFLESLYNEDGKEEKPVSPEKVKEIHKKLEAVENKTKSFRASIMEKLGTSGNELLSLADRGAKFFGENVDWKTKVFAGAGLVAAGALSAYATPVVLTAIGVTSLAMRGLSAASTYLVLKGVLDKKYEQWEKEGKTTSDIKKVMYGSGAAILAGVTGQAVGWLTEHGLSSLNDMVSHFSSSTITLPVPENISTPTIPEEILQTPQPSTPSVEVTALSPEIVHEVTKGQNLWSILRSTLSKENIDGFLSLTQGEQESRIQALVSKIAEDPKSFGIVSEKIDLIRAGEKLNLTSLFKK